jgi:uncharacterized protein YcfJ
MNKSMITGIAVGVAAATSIGGIAGYQILDKKATYAEVLQVEPVYRTVKTPRQDCRQVPVTHRAPVQDQNRVAGTAIGAVVGGLVGNQFGGGNGKTLMTVGGAVAGGYAGNQVQKGMQDRDTQTSLETRCRTVYDSHRQTAGYVVTYELDGKRSTVRTDHDPGPRIPVVDGKLLLDQHTGQARS